MSFWQKSVIKTDDLFIIDFTFIEVEPITSYSYNQTWLVFLVLIQIYQMKVVVGNGFIGLGPVDWKHGCLWADSIAFLKEIICCL